MFFRFVSSLLFTAILVVSSIASDYYFIVTEYNQSSLEGYSGRFWGKEGNKALLSGDQSDLRWLDDRNIRYEASEFDHESSILYVWYDDHKALDQSSLIYRGPDFAISKSAPDSDIPFRRLSQRSFITRRASSEPDILLTYDPVIDQMITEVSQDSIYDYLSQLSGASPIEIDGQQDTIHTRYSGTPDNFLAARFIRETLENYGYQSEFHGFYGGQIRHMASYDGSLAWLVTENSEFLRTSDGGQNWAVIPDGTDNSLWGIANWGANHVWFTGNSGTIKFSDDGGESFVSQNSGTSAFLFGVVFGDAFQGWVAGDFGTILHTTNGGQDWSSQSTPTGSRLYDVDFADSDYGWACGRDGVIIHSTDGGDTWTLQNSNTNQRLYGIKFTSNEIGWVVGWGGVVRHTTDGGSNWQTVSIGSNVEKYSVEFVDPQFGCIAGWNGEIFITTDGGDTWDQRSSGSQGDFYGVSFVDNQIGYAGGNGALVKTTDGGQTWFNQTQNIESAWRNIIGTKPGTTDPDQQVIICGHMDDRSQQPETNAPGADDNGSGTTAVIEAARIFSQYNFEKTIKFCLWTGEEQGLLGSAVYAAEAFARGDNIIGVFNFDMIAWDGNDDGSVEFHTGTENPSIALGDALLEVVNDYDIALNPEIITYGATGASDHASFWDNDYPAML
ncbi:MAG: M20/M25/M40 family metallo-hydrolase, partial [candidate division Zixibacteria bacterium]